MKGQTYVILAIILVIVVAVFAVINVDPVEVNYLFWTQESPLILVILFSVLMGGVITASVGAFRFYRLQKDLKLLKTENANLTKKLEDNEIPAAYTQNDTETDAEDNNSITK
ncbi:LapA family protein [Oceanobacillus damuensis]|uniref:LapA family protein n=1 Tax=Oceanobacillus damuensis TaxID=937928 RepID=UPI0008295278|nr:lipopolysaccharide assembly protein LapA domain-containing protein [Oceanobacillus damuensis]